MRQREKRMHEARILAEAGHKQGEIASRLGVSPRMVRYYITDSVGAPPVSTRASKIDPFKPFIASILEDDPFCNVQVLYDRLRIQGYAGRISNLRLWCADIRRGLIIKAVLRFETEPGRQAQVDWKEAGLWNINGCMVKVYAFVMLLGFSRRAFVWFTTSMKSSLLLACHLKAFAAFGGITHEILYDNMKTAWLFDGEHWVVNPLLLELASNLGFTPRRCQVRHPQTKGKVERFIQTLGNNFLPWAREQGLDSLDALNEQVNLWLASQGGQILRDLLETRDERFIQEAGFLLPFHPEAAPDVREVVEVTVSREGRLTFETNRYSVPARYLGQCMTLKVDRMAGRADLLDGAHIVRTLDLRLGGTHHIDDRSQDRADLLRLWELQNRPRLKVEPPVATEIPSVEIRHPKYYDELLEIRKAVV